MINIFEERNKREKRKKRLMFLGFYVFVPALFALLISTAKTKHSVCLFNWFCAPAQGHLLLKTLIVYVYILIVAAGLVYTYKGIEVLAKKKNHIRLFQYILIAVPVVFSAIIYMVEKHLTFKHYFFMILFGIFSVTGLLLIELRKK